VKTNFFLDPQLKIAVIGR